MVREPLEIRCNWCGALISPGKRFAKTKEPQFSLRGKVTLVFCEKCGEEREKRQADVEWGVMDEEFKAIDIDKYWVNVAESA